MSDITELVVDPATGEIYLGEPPPTLTDDELRAQALELREAGIVARRIRAQLNITPKEWRRLVREAPPTWREAFTAAVRRWQRVYTFETINRASREANDARQTPTPHERQRGAALLLALGLPTDEDPGDFLADAKHLVDNYIQKPRLLTDRDGKARLPWPDRLRLQVIEARAQGLPEYKILKWTSRGGPDAVMSFGAYLGRNPKPISQNPARCRALTQASSHTRQCGFLVDKRRQEKGHITCKFHRGLQQQLVDGERLWQYYQRRKRS